MTWTVTVGGQSFSNSNLDGTAYADEAYGFPALLAAFASEAGFLRGAGNTSATNFTPATGTQTLTLDQTPGFSVGALVCAKSVSDPTHYIIGAVAVVNGNDIDITATIANGGTGKADWVVTYPIPGTITDANGDLLLPNGSASTGAADNDLSAGGNRTVMDFNATKARLGGTAGGGAAVSVALVNGTSEILITDAGATDKTINGGNRFAGGLVFEGDPLGAISSTTASIAALGKEVTLATIGASVIFDFLAPPADHHYTKTLQITQDGTGARTPVFHRAGLMTQIQWTIDEPDWASQEAGVVTRVTAQYLDDWLYLSAKEGMKA